MKPWIAVVSVMAGKVTKYQDFDTQTEAEAHVAVYGGFIASSPNDFIDYWIADPVAKTLTLDAATRDADILAEQWVELRSRRDQLLKAGDDRFLVDAPPGRGNQAWRDYRQALRDLPANTVDPAQPQWPLEPDQ